MEKNNTFTPQEDRNLLVNRKFSFLRKMPRGEMTLHFQTTLPNNIKHYQALGPDCGFTTVFHLENCRYFKREANLAKAKTKISLQLYLSLACEALMK